MLGPVPKDGSVKISVEMENEKSKEVPIKKGMNYYEFPLNEDEFNAEEERSRELFND